MGSSFEFIFGLVTLLHLLCCPKCVFTSACVWHECLLTEKHCNHKWFRALQKWHSGASTPLSFCCKCILENRSKGQKVKDWEQKSNWVIVTMGENVLFPATCSHSLSPIFLLAKIIKNVKLIFYSCQLLWFLFLAGVIWGTPGCRLLLVKVS